MGSLDVQHSVVHHGIHLCSALFQGLEDVHGLGRRLGGWWDGGRDLLRRTPNIMSVYMYRSRYDDMYIYIYIHISEICVLYSKKSVNMNKYDVHSCNVDCNRLLNWPEDKK